METSDETTWIITSVIYFSDNELSYSKTRSVYSPAERVEQTLQTINSIRVKNGNSRIILMELGKRKDIGEELIAAVDEYIYLGKNLIVNIASSGKFKGLGEAVGLIFGIKRIKYLKGFCFKISGRYFLNDYFDYSSWDLNAINIRKYNDGMSTRLYGFPSSNISTLGKALLRSLPELIKGNSIEDVLPKHLHNSKITQIDILGVEGKVGPNGIFLSE